MQLMELGKLGPPLLSGRQGTTQAQAERSAATKPSQDMNHHTSQKHDSGSLTSLPMAWQKT